jgi:hypothetical protein
MHKKKYSFLHFRTEREEPMLKVFLIGAISFFLSACSQGEISFVSADVIRLMDQNRQPVRSTIHLADPRQVAEVASFFPNVGTGARSDKTGGWIALALVRLNRADGSVVEIKTNYESWTEGNGDWQVNGDFLTLTNKHFGWAVQ